MYGIELIFFYGKKSKWLYMFYGFVCKFKFNGFISFERDEIDVFRYLIVWFGFVMEWLI